ncbi:MAG: dCTP deaminase [Clostridium sp.]|uniref:dCTP deaminase n=1 Tax=Clostridium sp. TaxID=1506 RepID=UPI003F407BAF
MILTDINIRDRIKNAKKYSGVYEIDKFEGDEVKLIEPFNENQLESIAYDVKITNEITRFKNEYKKLKLDNKSSIDESYETIDITNGYELRPHEYILVKLKETINMPNDLVAHIRPRTSLNKIGIILSSQNINPSYCGRLSLAIYNASEYVIEIKPDLAIGQVVFEEITEIPTKEKLYINQKKAKYQNEIEFVGSKIYDDFQEQVDNEYKKILKKIRK